MPYCITIDCNITAKQVAKSTKAPLLPFLLEGVGGRPELMQDDGIHPNAQAQDRLADNVWPHLKPLLKP